MCSEFVVTQYLVQECSDPQRRDVDIVNPIRLTSKPGPLHQVEYRKGGALSTARAELSTARSTPPSTARAERYLPGGLPGGPPGGPFLSHWGILPQSPPRTSLARANLFLAKYRELLKQFRKPPLTCDSHVYLVDAAGPKDDGAGVNCM